jgi:hypothetical protein
MSDRQTATSHSSSTSYASSIIALVLGIELAALRRGRQIWPRLLIASIFGFAVLLLDSVVGLGWSCTGSPEPRSILPTVIKIGSSRHTPCSVSLRHSRTYRRYFSPGDRCRSPAR